MAIDMSLEDLAKEVRYLRDRQDILDCVNRYSRGLDRHDAEILTSVYHNDGIDEHGGLKFDNIPEFCESMNAIHDKYFVAHQHHVTNHNCELDGDTAHCESYVIVSLSLQTDPQKVWISSGRYIDRLERRDGKWKIAFRTSTLEWALEADGSLFADPAFSSYGFPPGTQNRLDPSYRRPLVPGPELFEAIAARKAAAGS